MRAPPAPAAGRRGTRFHSYGFVTVFRQFFGESGDSFCYTDLAERTSAKKGTPRNSRLSHTRGFSVTPPRNPCLRIFASPDEKSASVPAPSELRGGA